MGSLLRSRHRLPSPASSIRIFRSFSLPAKKDEADPEMIDQRKLPANYDPATFDPADHRSPPTDRVWRLVDEVSSLTLSEAADLSAALARKLDLKSPPAIGIIGTGAGAGVAGAAGRGGPPKEEKKPEKTVFELRLESFEAASKIKVIKEVRGFTNLGLKEAKELVEKAPAVIKGGVSKEEGQQIIEKMKAVGAKVVME